MSRDPASVAGLLFESALTMNKLLNKRVCTFGLLACVAACLSGCQTASPRHGAIVHNLTPDLLSTTHRPVDVRNKTSLVWNTTNRQFWDDLSRAALVDRPSRLSKLPVPH